MPRWALACWRPTTRWRRRASPCCSTSSIASARPSRRACLRRRWRMPVVAGAARAAIALAIDGALTPAAVTDEFLDLLERAGPYGQGNPQPRFAFPAHRVKFAKVVGGAHVRCSLEAGDGSRLDAVA